MTRRITAYHRSYRGHDEAAAERLLGERGYGHPYSDGSGHRWIVARDVVTSIANAMTLPKRYADRDDMPKVTGGDCVAGLTFMDQIRRTVDHNELALIEGALAAGVTWEQIGDALGYDPAESRAGCARRRHAKLRRSFPGFPPLVTPPEAL